MISSKQTEDINPSRSTNYVVQSDLVLENLLFNIPAQPFRWRQYQRTQQTGRYSGHTVCWFQRCGSKKQEYSALDSPPVRKHEISPKNLKWLQICAEIWKWYLLYFSVYALTHFRTTMAH